MAEQYYYNLRMGLGNVTASGIATLSGGLATVTNSNVTSTCFITFHPQDTDTLGTCRVGSMTPGVGFTINSTGATDCGVVAWEIKEIIQ